MGFKPAEVRSMTYADLLTCFVAYRENNRTGRPPITDEEDILLNALGDKFNAEFVKA